MKQEIKENLILTFGSLTGVTIFTFAIFGNGYTSSFWLDIFKIILHGIPNLLTICILYSIFIKPEKIKNG